MKYSSVDDLLDNKDEGGRDTVRPNLVITEGAWDTFRFALDYVNLNRPNRLHASTVVERSMNDFVENVKVRILKEEGTLNGLMMFMAERKLERDMERAARKSKGGFLSDRFKDMDFPQKIEMHEVHSERMEMMREPKLKKIETKGDTLDYTERKTVKRKKSDEE